jgi:hypothetical protein
MNEKHFLQIREKYRTGNSRSLFLHILALEKEIGFDESLSLLEKCVSEKRQIWLEKELTPGLLSGDPVDNAYKLFYEGYLGASIPRDGEIVERAPDRLVMRWWNPCPTLQSCLELGLDTRMICRKVYHTPVQVFFSMIDPRLQFERNYECIRPYTPYCEEIISLQGHRGVAQEWPGRTRA